MEVLGLHGLLDDGAPGRLRGRSAGHLLPAAARRRGDRGRADLGHARHAGDAEQRLHPDRRLRHRGRGLRLSGGALRRDHAEDRLDLGGRRLRGRLSRHRGAAMAWVREQVLARGREADPQVQHAFAQMEILLETARALLWRHAGDHAEDRLELLTIQEGMARAVLAKRRCDAQRHRDRRPGVPGRRRHGLSPALPAGAVDPRPASVVPHALQRLRRAGPLRPHVARPRGRAGDRVRRLRPGQPGRGARRRRAASP